jgi:O-antigen/teichoic acid export membrane protein
VLLAHEEIDKGKRFERFERMRVKRPTVGHLIQNAVALIVSGGGTSAVGVVFWAVAAHKASTTVVGRTSAEVAAIILISAFSQSSFGSTFVRFLPVAGDKTRMFVTRAYLLSIFIAFVLSTAYVSLGLGHRFLPSSFTWHALFVVFVVCWTIFALQDSVLIGLRSTRWVPVENIAYGLAKLALLTFFVAISPTQGLLLAWMTPVLIVIVVVNWYLFRRRIPEHIKLSSSKGELPALRQFISMTGAQYITLLVSAVSVSIVSLIVIDRLGPVASAHYYLPALIAGGATIALWSIDQSFLVEAAAKPDLLYVHARVAMKAGLAVVISCMFFGIIFAPYILKIFGPSYAASGTTLLRMLLLGLPGSAVTAFYTSFAWIDRRVWKLAVRDLISAGVYFALIFIFIGHFGILAVGIASIIMTGLQGVFFLPLLIKRFRKIPRVVEV